MRRRFPGSLSLRLALWFVVRGCRYLAAAGGSPARLIDLAAARDGQRVRRNVIGKCGAGSDVGAVTDPYRCHKSGIAAYEGGAADDCGILANSIVVAGEGAGAYVGFAPYARVAEIGEVHGLGTLAENAFLDLDEIADAGAFEQAHVAAEMREGPDLSLRRDETRVHDRIRLDDHAVADRDVAQYAAGGDRTAAADSRFAQQLHAGLEECVWADGDVRINQYRFWHHYAHAGGHEFVALAAAGGQSHCGQILARIATEDFVSIGRNESLHRFALSAEQPDGVGEIKLAMCIVTAKAGEAGPQLIQSEIGVAGIDLVHATLMVGERGVFHDGGDGAIFTPNDAAIARGAVHKRRQHRSGRGALPMH